MRLINAEDIKKRADCYPPLVRSVIANILSHTKTVKDAVEVVRCKDCKWWNDIGCAISIVDDSDKPDAGDYCSFGERSE